MFSVKICGITGSSDARVSVLAGADAIGLNFYQPSPRCVSPAQACSIIEAVPENVAKVGVFVNMSAEEILVVAAQVGLNGVQLHGDEPPEILEQLTSISTIRAFRLRDSETDKIVRYLDRCQQLECFPDAILLDAYRLGQFGGTGVTVNWKSLIGKTGLFGQIPFVLAGGLTPANVAEAIETIRPDAVDTASGVEIRPGEKDEALVRRFVTAARSALRS